MPRRSTLLGAASLAATYGALQRLGRTAGSTHAERRAQLPGDELVLRPQMVTDHATTIRAAPVDVWPWDTRYGARIVWTWTLTLTPLDAEQTRVHLRVRGRMAPWWFSALYVATIVPADLVMTTGMLRGLKQRAEARLPPAVSGRAPYEG